MKIIYTKDKEFKTEFENILKRAKSDIKGVSKIVENIIDEIVEDGNEALKRHIEKFDKWIVKSDDELLISQKDMKKAYETLDESLKKSLHTTHNENAPPRERGDSPSRAYPDHKNPIASPSPRAR